jgi:hypothetical protein
MLKWHHAADFFFLMSCGLFGISVGLAVVWARTRERAARAEAKLEVLLGAQRSPPDALAPAIDAIALEVERIGEGQRFLTQVLAEKRPNGEKRPQGSITPH